MAPSGAAGTRGPALSLRATDDLPGLRDKWSSLAARSGNLFATWEWASSWWRHYGDDRPLRLAECTDPSGETVAILPLYLAFRRPTRVARMIGHGPADELGPVGAPEQPGVAAALAGSADVLGWRVLLADRLAAERPLAGAIGGRCLLRESSPVIDVDGLTWDGYLGMRSSNFRWQVRRKERKLQRDHGLTYRLSSDPDGLTADLDALFALHRARWGAQGSGALDGTREAFHRDFAAEALRCGWLRLWVAEVDDRPVAIWYGFRYGGADWYYQFGRDPSWDRSSVGLVLLAHTVREAIADGQRSYKLLRGGEDYKDRMATGDPGLVTLALDHGVSGRLAVASAQAALSSPAPLRSRLLRFVG